MFSTLLDIGSKSFLVQKDDKGRRGFDARRAQRMKLDRLFLSLQEFMSFPCMSSTYIPMF
jgi:hypothetical protein